jgi:hypothetical protein
LEGELVMKIKKLKGHGSPWLDYCCGPQTKPKVLGGDVDVIALMASAMVDIKGMNAVSVKNS